MTRQPAIILAQGVIQLHANPETWLEVHLACAANEQEEKGGDREWVRSSNGGPRGKGIDWWMGRKVDKWKERWKEWVRDHTHAPKRVSLPQRGPEPSALHSPTNLTSPRAPFACPAAGLRMMHRCPTCTAWASSRPRSCSASWRKETGPKTACECRKGVGVHSDWRLIPTHPCLFRVLKQLWIVLLEAAERVILLVVLFLLNLVLLHL